MSNKVENFLHATEHILVVVAEKIAGVASKFEKVLVAEQKLKPEFIADAKLLIADAVAMAAAVSAAYATKGANWPQDVTALQSVQKLVADIPTVISGVEDAFNALESAIS